MNHKSPRGLKVGDQFLTPAGRILAISFFWTWNGIEYVCCSWETSHDHRIRNRSYRKEYFLDQIHVNFFGRVVPKKAVIISSKRTKGINR